MTNETTQAAVTVSEVTPVAVEATPEVVEAPAKSAKKTSKKSTPKKAPKKTETKPAQKSSKKVSKKTAEKTAPVKAKKASKKADKATPKAKAETNGRVKDDARAVGKEMGLKADQVRILRALKNGEEIDRTELKVRVGIGAEGKYSSGWLNGLWDLYREHKFISISQYDSNGRDKHYHQITKEGKQALTKAEKAFADNSK